MIHQAVIQGINVKPGTPCIHPSEIQISQEFDRAKLDLLRKVHSTEYLNFVNELSKDLERQHKEKTGEDEDTNPSGAAPVVPFTPMVSQLSTIGINRKLLQCIISLSSFVICCVFHFF